jgi:C4-dicarboxylate transporter DctM subunit
MHIDAPTEVAPGAADIERGFRIEQWVIGAVLVAMAMFTFLEVTGRSALGAGVPGGLLYTQHLTLWVGFLGALLATATGGHLALATGSFFKGETIRRVSRFYSDTFSAAVCALLCVASMKMVRADMQHTSVLPGGLPEWWSELVMPVSVALMAVRFAWRASDTWLGRGASVALALSVFLLAFAEPFASHLLWPGALFILVGVVLGTPVFVAMAALAMLLFFTIGTPIAAVPTETFRLVASPSLPAIPLLTATGYVLAEGGASRRFLALARAWFGWAPGGMALMVCGVCAGFTTFTGGSGVTLLALGGIVMPMLLSEKYGEDFSLGLVTASGSLGLLFPPSLPVILYAIVAGASITELYFAGLLPGLLMVVLVAGYALFSGQRFKVPRHRFHPWEAVLTLWEAKWELFVPALVVVSLFMALATPVEAAGLSLLAAILVETVVLKFENWGLRKVFARGTSAAARKIQGYLSDQAPRIEPLPFRGVFTVLARAGTLTGAVLILLGVAMGLTSYLVDAEVPRAVVDWTTAHIKSPWLFLLVLNAVLLVVGSIVEIYAAIVVLAPLIAPMAAAYQIDALHLGIVFLANLELGFLLPPMGLNLILASSRFNKPLVRLYRVIVPFFVILAVGLLLVTYVPAMTVGFVDKFEMRSTPKAQPAHELDEDGKERPVNPESFDWDAE